MQRLIQSIIDQRIPCYFISPHLDDAVLSAGGLIRTLAGKTDVTVVTIFSKATPNNPSHSARTFVRQCGYHDSETLFQDRRKEDRKVLKNIGVHIVHLGFVDALWRMLDRPAVWRRQLGRWLPEIVSVYPTYRFHVSRGRPRKGDRNLVGQIVGRLTQLLPADGQYMVFCPRAIGRHVDHVITRQVCEEAFPQTLIAWTDFPYNVRENLMGQNVWRWTEHLRRKREDVEAYRTQASALFSGQPTPLVPEEYRPI